MVTEIVKPGACFVEVVSQAKRLHLTSKDYLILIAGANDAYNFKAGNVFSNLVSALQSFKYCNVFITGIPFRQDLPLYHKINEDIMELNLFIFEQTRTMNNVSFVDMTAMSERCFTKPGVHLNWNGKQILSSRILRVISSENLTPQLDLHQPNKPSSYSTVLMSNCKYSSAKSNIKVTNVNMSKMIQQFSENPSVAFSHCISADIGHERHMSAGVAVTFGRCFGKPTEINRVKSHLTYQKKNNYSAGVFGLITKPKYFLKPSVEDYNLAFEELEELFKMEGYKHLICSPMGCVRDRVDLKHFISNLTEFQHRTKASITIVSYEQKSHRTLFNGLPHDLFLKKMEQLIDEAGQPPYFASPNTAQSQNFNSSFDSQSPFCGWKSAEVPGIRKESRLLEKPNDLEPLTPSASPPPSLMSTFLDETCETFSTPQKTIQSPPTVEIVNFSNVPCQPVDSILNGFQTEIREVT